MPDNLRTRIIAVLEANFDDAAPSLSMVDMADAVIRELDGEFLDFGLWLSEEMRGEPMSRIDLESCIEEWKASGA